MGIGTVRARSILLALLVGPQARKCAKALLLSLEVCNDSLSWTQRVGLHSQELFSKKFFDPKKGNAYLVYLELHSLKFLRTSRLQNRDEMFVWICHHRNLQRNFMGKAINYALTSKFFRFSDTQWWDLYKPENTSNLALIPPSVLSFEV